MEMLPAMMFTILEDENVQGHFLSMILGVLDHD